MHAGELAVGMGVHGQALDRVEQLHEQVRRAPRVALLAIGVAKKGPRSRPREAGERLVPAGIVRRDDRADPVLRIVVVLLGLAAEAVDERAAAVEAVDAGGEDALGPHRSTIWGANRYCVATDDDLVHRADRSGSAFGAGRAVSSPFCSFSTSVSCVQTKPATSPGSARSAAVGGREIVDVAVDEVAPSPSEQTPPSSPIQSGMSSRLPRCASARCRSRARRRGRCRRAASSRSRRSRAASGRPSRVARTSSRWKSGGGSPQSSLIGIHMTTRRVRAQLRDDLEPLALESVARILRRRGRGSTACPARRAARAGRTTRTSADPRPSRACARG